MFVRRSVLSGVSLVDDSHKQRTGEINVSRRVSYAACLKAERQIELVLKY